MKLTLNNVECIQLQMISHPEASTIYQVIARDASLMYESPFSRIVVKSFHSEQDAIVFAHGLNEYLKGGGVYDLSS